MRLSLFLFACCALLGSNILRADTVTSDTLIYGNYDQTVAGAQYNTGTGLSVSLGDAVPFTNNLAAPPEGYSWALSYITFAATDNNFSQPVNVSLFSDSGGLPGTALETFSVNLSSTNPETTYILCRIRSGRLGGQYCIVLSIPMPRTTPTTSNGTQTVTAWRRCHLHRPLRLRRLRLGQSADTQGAVQVFGTLVNAQAPEPGTFAVLGAGMMLLAFRRRKSS